MLLRSTLLLGRSVPRPPAFSVPEVPAIEPMLTVVPLPVVAAPEKFRVPPENVRLPAAPLSVWELSPVVKVPPPLRVVDPATDTMTPVVLL